MKKKYRILLIAIILVAIIAIIICNYFKKIDKEYEIEKPKEYYYFVLKQNDLYGVIDKKGQTIITAQFDEVIIPNPEKGTFICYQDEKTKVLNEKQEEILTQYNNVQPIRLKNIVSDLMYEKSILAYEKDGKYGLINFEGKQITKPIYDQIDSLPYKEGEFLVKQNEKCGVINLKGNQIIAINYEDIAVDEYFTDQNRYQYAGYIVAIKTQEGYRYGYLDRKGKKIAKTEYNELSRINEIQDIENSYIICAKNGQYGVLKNEKELLPNEYQSIRYDTTNEVFVVEKSKKFGIVNLEGNNVIPIQYDQIDITGIYLYAQDDQGTTVYDKEGKQQNIEANVAILNTSNEEYKIKIKNENGTHYGVINKEGELLIEEKYNYIDYLYDNNFIVSYEGGKLGILDDKENIKIELKYDSLQKIQDTELIQTTLVENKITQIYAKTMEKVCEMQNATVEIEKSFIKIYNEQETKYFDKEGKELKSTEVYPNNSLYVVSQNNQYGFMDRNQSLVVDYQYDKAYEFNQYGFATIKKDGKWGSINEQGKEVALPQYEIEGQEEPSFIGSYYRVTYGFGEFYYTQT